MECDRALRNSIVFYVIGTSEQSHLHVKFITARNSIPWMNINAHQRHGIMKKIYEDMGHK